MARSAVGTQKKELRIVLLGKTGCGKSSIGSTILGENVFTASGKSISATSECKSETRDRNHCRITVIDTPGFFDTRGDKKNLKEELLKCIIECSPGPHAFLIVLKVERHTEQEQHVINYVNDLFGEEALKYSMIVFTHGDDLDSNETIDDFVKDNEKLKSFVDKCGGGCHVIDNKYWNQSQDRYRNNTVQIEKIIGSIENMVMRNGGGCYTNKLLKMIQAKKKEEEQKHKNQMEEQKHKNDEEEQKHKNQKEEQKHKNDEEEQKHQNQKEEQKHKNQKEEQKHKNQKEEQKHKNQKEEQKHKNQKEEQKHKNQKEEQKHKNQKEEQKHKNQEEEQKHKNQGNAGQSDEEKTKENINWKNVLKSVLGYSLVFFASVSMELLMKQFFG